MDHEERFRWSRMRRLEGVEYHPLCGQCRGPAVDSCRQRLFDEGVHVPGIVVGRGDGSETCSCVVMVCVAMMRGLVMRDAVHRLDRGHRTGRDKKDEGTECTLDDRDAHVGMVTRARRKSHLRSEPRTCPRSRQRFTRSLFFVPQSDSQVIQDTVFDFSSQILVHQYTESL